MSSPRSSPSRIDFAGSPRPTVGVEWEFALVDPDTRDLSNEAAAVIAEIGETPHVHKELLRNTVEIVTGICETVPEAMTDLHDTLVPVRRIARERGMELFCAGTHPFAEWSHPAAHRGPALRRADQAHPVVGPPDAHLGSARARRDLLGAQGDAHHHLAAQPVPAPAGAVGVIALLGR